VTMPCEVIMMQPETVDTARARVVRTAQKVSAHGAQTARSAYVKDGPARLRIHRSGCACSTNFSRRSPSQATFQRGLTFGSSPISAPWKRPLNGSKLNR
jgi:hypothetical protein